MSQDDADRSDRAVDRQGQLELFEALTDALPEYTFIYDQEGTYLDAITGWERGTERHRGEDLIGQNVSDVFPADTAEKLRSAISEALAAERPQTVEYPIGTEANLRWYEATLVPVPGGYRGERAVLLTAHQITDRREFEQQLSGLHNVAVELATADSVEAVCDLTVEASEVVLDFDISIIDIEDGGRLVLTATSGDTPPEGATSMSTDEGIAGLTYQTGQSYLIDDLKQHEEAAPQGPYRSVISIPLGPHGVFQAAAGEPEAFDEDDLEIAELLVTHATQALDRLERERSLERQNKRLEEFASLVSHDLRNPLNVAMGRVELARAEADSEHLGAVAMAHDRMETLIENMLALARSGESVGETAPVELRPLLDTCWRNVETADAELHIDTDMTIEADRTRLQQLLENLLRNAVDHGGPEVTVRVADHPGGFYVEDDGPGIPSEERIDVLKPGYTTTDHGTGIGLSIVRDIAEAHGWELDVRSGTEGGARFEFSGVQRA